MTTLPREVYLLPQSRGALRRQTSMSYCSSSGSPLESCGSENNTTKWPGHRADSTGSKSQAMIGMEKHHRPEPHGQNLLCSLEIASSEKRHTRGQLGIRWQTISNSPNNCPSVQSNLRADRTTPWTVRRSLGCQQNFENFPANILLALTFIIM